LPRPATRPIALPIPLKIATVRFQNMTATPAMAANAEAIGIMESGPM